MTLKAVFYILSDSALKARDLYTCRLVDKAYLNQQKIYIYLNNIEEVRSFDTQLWTFRDISFVPHEIYQSDKSPDAPVVIGCDALNSVVEIVVLPRGLSAGPMILVNLATTVPTFYAKFKHIIEIIPDEVNLKKLGRKKYKIYQEHGYQMETFNIQL